MRYVIVQPRAEEACRMMILLQRFLDPAIAESHGEMGIQDVFGRVLQQLMKVWLVCEEESRKLAGVAITEDVEYPNHSNLRVVLLGGSNMAEWQDDLDEAMLDYCGDNNLAYIEVVGRKGFSRVLAPLGYEPAYTVLLKSTKEVYCG